MAGHCSNCGAELFAGQQYCRRCGAPTRQLSTGEVPTQILPGGQPAQGEPQQEGPSGETTRVSARDTDPVYPSRFAGRHGPTAGGPGMTAPLDAGQAPRRRRRAGWIIALAAAVLVLGGGAVFLAGYIASEVGRSVGVGPTKIVIDKPKPPAAPANAAAPPAASEEALGEDDADVSDDETVFTETFPVAEGDRIALVNVAGDISVEGWDEDEAELKVTKRGGTPQERARVRIVRTRTADWLKFRTDAGRAGGRAHEVRYELKLPRRLRMLDVVSEDSNVSVSELVSGVGVVVARGNVEVEEVEGTISARTTKGNLKVGLDAETPKQHVVLEATNGNVEVELARGANVEIKAETLSGRVEADESLPLRRERGATGEHASGRLGRGGKSIVAKTLSGDIKITER
jgi:Putative adhesin